MKMSLQKGILRFCVKTFKYGYNPSSKAGIKCFLGGDNVSLVNKKEQIETLKYKDILNIIREHKNNLNLQK